jgi:formate hydrogenlyase subunit 6/NADH:ubiquinone oxidoreductase subunit I
MASTKRSYWRNIASTSTSLLTGLRITFGHLLRARKSLRPKAISDPTYFKETEGIATIQFPYEMQPVPDTGRYRLHNEIDDCIVCDKCVKVCPVNCITIEPIKSPEEIGKTSDGTPKRIYAAKFDIDMGKCCFCGLCTTVCPTECLTMTKVFDFSVFDIRDHNFEFAEMSDQQITEKKMVWETHQKNKAISTAPTTIASAEKSDAPLPKTETGAPPAATTAPKPVFRPKIKPPPPAPPPTE